MNAYCCSRPISRFRFLRSGRYRPPVDFRFDRPCQRATFDLEGAVPSPGPYLTVAALEDVQVSVDEEVGQDKPEDGATVQEGQARLRVALQHEPHEDDETD